MPKIAEIEPTPNPNAMKFILREPLTWGITRSYDSAAQAVGDPLAMKLFDIEHVTNVFYVDHWITVTQDGGADWQELMRSLAAPIREAPSADANSDKLAEQSDDALDPEKLSPEDRERLEAHRQGQQGSGDRPTAHRRRRCGGDGQEGRRPHPRPARSCRPLRCHRA